ncbi:hypothetical protein L2E82_33569 [Cichorium intybus]|uniref:Uncharacterized protein n=1 Tax=Cichorium intybus TaxID=13427 RepID=A0ACB9BKJ2_CICIN|nr:hypothetical protein L2E82_33569 [Cichorium intybus]
MQIWNLLKDQSQKELPFPNHSMKSDHRLSPPENPVNFLKIILSDDAHSTGIAKETEEVFREAWKESDGDGDTAVSAASESGSLQLPTYRRFISDQEPRIKSPPRLSNPLIGDDRKIYICSEKNLLVFHNNGSISRTIPLKYKCNVGITPVLGASRKVYLVASNRLLTINTMHTQTPQSTVEVFLGPETGVHGMNDIIGFSVSITSSSVLVAIQRTGLFAYSYSGKLRWSTGPVISRLGYRQGCRKNITGCYFDSAPVIDHCDANIYVLNNQGELYAVSIRSSQFKWIQNLNSFGKRFSITAGNNGKLYVIVADRSVIVGLDVRTGTVVWEQSIGPLITQDLSPVVDVNGWISIGSLDGFLYSVSPSGILKKFPKTEVMDTVMEVNPVLDCSGYAVYIMQTKLDGKIRQTIGEYTYASAMKPVNSTFTLLVPATGSVYWSESYPGSLSSFFSESDLMRFLLEERVLVAFLSISNNGNPLTCFSTRQKIASSCSLMETKQVTLYTGNEKAITLFLFFETILLIFLTALKSLRIQKKVFNRTITELEKKATEGKSTNEVMEKLGDLVREKERIERKLSTHYSLGEDMTTPESESLIPVSDKKSRSYSFKSGKKESVTVFHAISESSEEDNGNGEEEKRELKGKGILEMENVSDDKVLSGVQKGGVKIADVGIGGGSMRKRSLSLNRNISSSK